MSRNLRITESSESKAHKNRCYNFYKKNFSFSRKLYRALRFTGFSTKTSTSVASNNNVELSLDVCCNKKTLAKPPSPNGHLARRDRRLLFSGEEIGRWPPPSPLNAPSCRIFFQPSNVPQETTLSTRALPFPTDFSIKLRKRPAGVRGGIHHPLPSTHPPCARAKVGVAARCPREGK